MAKFTELVKLKGSSKIPVTDSLESTESLATEAEWLPECDISSGVPELWYPNCGDDVSTFFETK